MEDKARDSVAGLGMACDQAIFGNNIKIIFACSGHTAFDPKDV